MPSRAVSHRRRLVLADDHEVILEGLALVLAGAFDVVDRVTSGPSLIAAVDRVKPDAVVTDVSMPGMTGIVAARRITEAHPEVRVVMLSMHPDPEYAVSAIEAGASAYVLKHDAASVLVDAIEGAFVGRLTVPESIREEFERLRLGRSAKEELTLTARQIELMRLVAYGLTAREIASELGISRKTVEYHKYRLIEQLGVTTTADLIRAAIDRGIVEPGA